MINNAILGVISGARIVPPAPTDPYYSFVVALLHFNDTPPSSTFVDQKGGTWTRSGSGATSATQSKFGGASLAVLNTADYISHASDAKFGYGTGDFTIEMWIYPSNVPASVRVVFDQRSPGAPSAARPAFYLFGTQLRYYVSGADRITGGVISASSWHHVAISRVSGQTRMYLNGAQVGSTWTDGTNYTSSPAVVATQGDSLGGTLAFTGYVDDLRITKGVGRYSGASFTVPSAQFPDA